MSLFCYRNAVTKRMVISRSSLWILIGFLAAMFMSCAIEGQNYESRGRRDPFVPLIGVNRPAIIKLEDVTSIDDIKLEGIAFGAMGKRSAMLNGEVLRENDVVGDIKIEAIRANSVGISLDGKAYELYFKGQEGGSKGE